MPKNLTKRIERSIKEPGFASVNLIGVEGGGGGAV